MFGSAAPSAGSFSFGAPATAAAPASGFNVFNTPGAGVAPAAAPAAPSSFSFGAPASAAPSSGLFGGFGGAAPAQLPPTPSFFGAPAAHPATQLGMFGAPAGGGLFGAAQPVAAQPTGGLTTRSGAAITHATKWEDLTDASQQQLLAVEQLLHQNRASVAQLSAKERTKAPQSIDARAGELRHSMARLRESFAADGDATAQFRDVVLKSLRDAEDAVAAYERARLRGEAKLLGANLTPEMRALLAATGRAPAPSPALLAAVEGFDARRAAYEKQAAELERVLCSSSSNAGDSSSPAMPLDHALKDAHAFLLHVASVVGRAHERVAQAKDALLLRDGQRGGADPFKAAEELLRREQEAAQHSPAPPFAASPAPSATVPPPPSTFGAAQALLPAQQAPTPGIFGAMGASAAAAASPVGGLFGAATAAPPSPVPFSGFASASAAPTPFGATLTPQAAPPAAGGLFAGAGAGLPATPTFGGAATGAFGFGGAPASPAPAPTAFGAFSPQPFGAQGAAAPGAKRPGGGAASRTRSVGRK